MSVASRLAYAIYAGLTAVAGPIFATRDARRLRAAGVAPDRIAERRGNATRPRPAGRLIWIHAVSVGEARSILPLLGVLPDDVTPLVTTTSASSAELMSRELPGAAIHQFAPLDTPGAVRRFLEHWQPWAMVLTESELWPRQIAAAHWRGCPVILVNARASDRSLARWRKLAPLARHMTERLALVLAQDARTRDGLVALGLPPDRAEVTGSLKFASAPRPVDPAALAPLRASVGSRPAWLAASTHEGEEAIAAAAHARICADIPDALMILAPRHPDRADAIAADLRKGGWRVARRSAGEAIAPDTRIYLADTLGEMGLWHGIARAAFVGGSFAPRGGHTPFEAAQAGLRVVSGPDIANFTDIYAALEATGGARVVSDPDDLAAALRDALDAGAAPPLPPGLAPDPRDIAARIAPFLHDPAPPEILAPNLKRRLSGVTATVVRLVPVQSRLRPVRASGPALPPHVPQIPLGRLAFLPRDMTRVWHARRNVEMIAGMALRQIARRRLRLLFTSASQRHHTGLTRWLIARMDGVVATSDKSAAYLARPATVIRHGIDCDAFHPEPGARDVVRARLGIPPEGELVGCFGRLRASKGTDIFVDAMIAVARARPGVTALVMGRAVGRDEAFRDDLVARVAQAGLEGRVVFLPEVETHQTPRYYAALDLYVAPQRWEGFGLTPLEAMAAGLPVVATRTGAFDEIVEDGRTGRLVPPGDADALAAAILAVLDAPDRADMGAAGLARARAVFSLEAEAEALDRVYRDLLDG
ncbi:glycosyltransferase [Palleronia sediminis]|uniref:3-deoxy-D-manno-octulosonic acid transferase n=1 Tax=Palleronia sediminis TaxID=2547833 RepID=A0A4V3BAS9_9RHOB|nr:glycosyltransferase [Palleronia sediminis]